MGGIRGAVLVVAVCALALVLGGAAPSRADAPAPPAEYAALYSELSQGLTAFEGELDAQWDESVGDTEFAGSLASANGNKSTDLMKPGAWQGILAMLDRMEAQGVELVKVEMEYPLQTPAFHQWLAAHPPAGLSPYPYTADYFIGYPQSFYNRVAAEIRARGMGLWVEYGTIFADYSPTPPQPYFAEMRTAGIPATQARYRNERSAEAALIVSQMAPDYMTILEEPDTQNDNFGYFAGGVPLFTTAGWQGYVQQAAAQIAAAAPGSPSLLGAGSGTWDTRDYIELFAAMPELDFIDLHVYPLRNGATSYLQRTLDWIDYIRAAAPAKKITIGEAWLYKASAAEVANSLDYNTIFGRDVYSFWEPLDTQYLEVLFKLAHLKHVDAVMPYWVQYYHAYLTYGDPSLEGLTGPQLIARASQAAGPNLLAGIHTATGEKFIEILAVPLSPDADGDGYPDTQDNCPHRPNATQALPAWPLAANDSDCDGFSLAAETFVASDATRPCAASPAMEDEAGTDAWPFDFNDDQVADLSDVLKYNMAGIFGSSAPGPPYGARYDLNADGGIDLSDVLMYNVAGVFGNSCAP